MVILENFKSLYDWIVDVGFSPLYGFICPYHITYDLTLKDDTVNKAKYVASAMLKGGATRQLYLAPYNMG